MASIGTNTIRVYHVNPWLSHDACMGIMAKYGIYLLLDVDTFNTTIDAYKPKWTWPQLSEFQHVIDSFSQYGVHLARLQHFLTE